MSSTEVTLETPPPIPGNGDVAASLKPPSSLLGIRWLLLIGALVVTVSVIRLVAAEWQHLTPTVQFLILVGGALGVWAAGDVTQRRLHLPVAGSALQALFVFLVPLLAWGASHQRLMETGLGTLAVLGGLTPLVWACGRLLRRRLGYDGAIYTTVFGLLLAAIPGLPAVSHAFFLGEGFFLASALVLGLLLRQGSRHINRFFFHRDRLHGVEQTVHWLPFGMLLVAYGAAMTSFDVPTGWLVVPLALAAWALVDSGEEYYRALVQAEGRPVVRWPRRSVLLLTVGFGALAVALGAAPLAGWPRGWAVVCLLATARLLLWALRYRSVAAYGTGLLAAVLAYHAVPALVPSLAQEIYQWLLRSLGMAEGGVALLGLADLGLVALLILGAMRWRRRLSPNMLHVHTAVLAIQSTVVLLSGLAEPRALRWAALLALPLMLWAVHVLRRVELLPWAYGAVVCAALGWGWQASDPMLWTTRGAFLMALGTGVYLLVGWMWTQRRNMTSRLWLALPTLCGTVPLAVVAVILGDNLAGMLWLLLAPSFALTALLLRRPGLGLWVGLTLSLGVFDLAVQDGDVLPFLSLAALGLVAVGWALGRIPGRELPSRLGRWVGHTMAVFSGAVGLILMCFIALDDQLTWEPLIVLLYGAYFFDTAGRHGGLRTRRAVVPSTAPWLAGLGLSLAIVFPVVQWMAWFSFSAAPLLLVLAAAMGGLMVLSKPSVAGPVASFYGVETDDVRGVVQRILQGWLRLWRFAAVAVCLVWAGPWTLLLATVLAAEAVWRWTGRGLSPPPVYGNGLLLGVTLLPLLQLIEQIQRGLDGTGIGGDGQYLLPMFVEARGLALPMLMAALWGWGVALHRVLPQGKRPQILLRGAQALAALACLWPLLVRLLAWPQAQLQMLTDPTVALAAYGIPALAFALWSLGQAWLRGDGSKVWDGQAWLFLAWQHGLVSPWLQLDTVMTALLLLSIAVCLDGLTGLLRRRDLEPPGRRAVLRALNTATGGWAMLGSVASLWVGLSHDAPWWPVMPLVVASLFYTLRARNGHHVVGSACLASALFAVACTLWVFRLSFLGPEMYFLGPGLALMALSWLLEPRLDAVTRNQLFTWGAVAVYGTPLMGLLGELGWIWQIALLLTAITFGGLSFRLRSRSLLTVSTAAVVVDLVFFLVKLRRSEPTLLWIGGIAFGLALMAGAALLEHRREDMQQRLRVWGRVLASWN